LPKRLAQQLAACITDPRLPQLIKHNMSTMVGQRVYGIALGYEDLNDHQTLRNDKMIQLMTSTAKTAASKAGQWGRGRCARKERKSTDMRQEPQQATRGASVIESR